MAKKFEVKRAEKLVSVCLDGSLVAEYESVSAELETKRKQRIGDRRMNDPVAALERRQVELWEAQESAKLVFRLRALPRKVWSDLRDDHPARKDNAVDEHYGFNTDTLFDAALATEGVIVEVTQGGEAVDFSHEDWSDFASELTVGQHVEFANAIKDINGGHAEVPFSYAAYKKIQGSEASSK